MTDLLDLEQYDFESILKVIYMKIFLNILLIIILIPGSISGNVYHLNGKQLIFDNGSQQS